MARRHPAEVPERRRPQDPVDGEPGVALEVRQGLGGELAEDAVHPTGVEPEGGKASLQVSDVVAPQHGPAEVEEAVAQTHARLDHRSPGLGPAHAADPEAPAVLEALYRSFSPDAEDPFGVRSRGQLDKSETSLQVSDGLALVARGEGESVARFYRYACSSWRSCALPRAPMMRSTGSPSLNNIRVGMLITSKRLVMSRFSSMLSLAT